MDTAAEGTTCAIIGAGLGGIGLIAMLGLEGYRLRLCDRDETRIAALRERGGLEVEGIVAGFARLELATTELAAAVEGADVVIVVTGGNTHAEVARELAGLVQDGQAILLVQGGTGGSLIVRRALGAAGCRAEVDVAEMDNYPCSLGVLTPTRVRMTTFKQFLQVAALPAARAEAVLARLRRGIPRACAAPNLLSTGFTNMNAVLHVANMVANVGRIEAGVAYRFYADGVTPGVAHLYDALDAERLAVARAFGASVPSVPAWIEQTYGVREPSLVATMQRLTYDEGGPYQWTPTPKSLDYKYLTEDVPCGLVPMGAIGRVAGVPTPVIDGLVAVSSALLRRDFVAEGRTLERLGLAGHDAQQLRATLEHGFR